MSELSVRHRPDWFTCRRIASGPVLILLLAAGMIVRAGMQSLSFTLPEGQEFTNAERLPFSLSVDGTRIAYVARGILFVKDLSGGAPRAVRGPVEARSKSNPIFTPDGQAIVYWAQDDAVLERVPVDGGMPRRLAKIANPSGMSWASDRSLLVGQGDQGIVRVDLDTGSVASVVTLGRGEQAIEPQILPDGESVLFSLGSGTPTQWTIVAQSLKTGTRTAIVAGSNGWYLPEGVLAYVVGASILIDRLDVATLKIFGRPVTIAKNVQVAADTGAALFSASRNGVLAFSGNAATPVRMALVSLDGARTFLGEVLANASGPRLSGDGKRVTFYAATPGRGRDIYVADLTDVSNPKRVISDGSFPVLSPDGQWLVFGSLNTIRENGEEALFMQPADGSGRARLIATPARAPEHWRPGPQGFTFISHRGTGINYDLWAYNPDRKEAEPLAVLDNSAQLSGAFSPDLRWFAYMSSESGDWEIWVQPYPRTGEKYQVTVGGGGRPMWLPGGRIIFERNGAIASVLMQPGTPPTFSQPIQHPISGFYSRNDLRRDWDVMPDGRLLMMFRDSPRVEVITGATNRLPVLQQ